MLGSFRGIPIKIFAAVLALIALGAGIYISFFQTAGFETTKATITSIREIVDVMAATHIKPKNTVQVNVGLNMCWKTAGSVTNVSSGPWDGVKP